MKRVTPGSLVLAGVLLAGHCALASAPVKNCDLITQQAAEAVFGAHLNPARDMGMGCTYTVGENSGKGVLVTLILPMRPAVAMPQAALYEQFLDSDPTAVAAPVSGLGDKAHFITPKDGALTRVVHYHSSIASISAYSSPNANLRAALTQAMRQLMQKL